MRKKTAFIIAVLLLASVFNTGLSVSAAPVKLPDVEESLEPESAAYTGDELYLEEDQPASEEPSVLQPETEETGAFQEPETEISPDQPDAETEASEEQLEPETAAAPEENTLELLETEPESLHTPVLESCKNKDQGIRLTWKAVKGAASYIIYAKRAGGKFKQVGTATGTSFTYKKAVPGKLYYYTVAAVGKKSKGNYNKTGLKGVWLKSIVPSVSCVRGTVKLSWEPEKNVKGYLIYRRLAGKSWSKYSKTTETSFIDLKAASGKTYEYRIQAYVSCEGSTYKSVFTSKSTVAVINPSAIPVSSVTSVSGGMKVKWKADPNASGYNVFRKEGSSGWKKIGKAKGASYTDKKVQAGVKCLYKISVCHGTNAESVCGSYKAGVFLPKASMNTLENRGNYVRVAWNKADKAAGYRLYRRVEGAASWTVLADVEKNYYKDYNSEYGKKCEYLVRPYIKIGKKTYYGYKDKTCKSVIVRLQTPKITVVANSLDENMTISWTAIEGADRYEIYRWSAAQDWVKLASQRASAYIDKKVTKGIAYRYKVIAYKGAYFSNEKVSAEVKLPGKIDLPDKRYIDLGWDVDPRYTGGPAYYDSYATDWAGRLLVNKNVWANHNTYKGSSYKPHAGDIIVYGQEDANGRVYQHVDICVKTYDAKTGTFGVISGNWGSDFTTSPIAYVDKSWVDYTAYKNWYSTIHNIWQCKLNDTKKTALINSAYLMLEEYNKDPDYVRGKILECRYVNWCDIFVAYTIFIAR